jgi:glucose-6-phosphate 1-dehydrogenase
MQLVWVIFGGTGDLSQRKLIPALHGLYAAKELPADFLVIGFGRKVLTQEAFKALFAEAKDLEFAKHLAYVQGDYGSAGGYQELAKQIPVDANAVFYLSTPPEVYGDIVLQLKSAGIASAKGWRRVVIEKPFGSDLATARQLNDTLAQAFAEEQIFRIDHYLGKETVQDIARKQHWRDDIDHVQITVAEDLGVEGRAGYYDTAGALRDMVQSHILQVLALVAKEQGSDVRQAKLAVLRSLSVSAAVRAQYDGYRDEVQNPKSETETFVALKLRSLLPRWKGIPFFIRTGKRLPARFAEAHIVLKDGKTTALPINPRSGKPSREAHEILFSAIIRGDSALFPSWNEIEACWTLVDGVIAGWKNAPVRAYAQGGWGPEEANALVRWVS